MSREIDIRTKEIDKIISIRICDKQLVGDIQADVLIKCGGYSAKLKDTADGAAKMHIPSKVYAQDLIKAIEKAIELGWVK
jgi:hypothetical protein